MAETLEDEVLSFIEEMDVAIAEDSESYSSMYVFFAGKQKYYTERGELALADAAAILASITHMALDAESKNMPVIAAYISQEERSVSPEDLKPEHRAFLENLYPQLVTGLLKSRIAEITLMLDTPRRWELVDEILKGYLAESLSDKTWHIRQENLWVRAVTLSRQFGKKTTVRLIEERIQNYIDEHSPENPGISMSLYYFIHKWNLLDSCANTNAAGIMAFGVYEKSNNRFSIAERLFSLAADFYKRQRNNTEQLNALFESAECLFFEAESRSQFSGQGNLIAISLYERALQRYRLIPTSHRSLNGADVRIEECLRRVRVHGELSLEDMHSYQLPPINLTELAELSVNHVKDKGHIFKASLYFVGFNTIKADSVQGDGQERLRISDLFDTVFLSGDGRAISRTGAASNDRARTRQMEAFDISLKVAVVGTIQPAMYQLLQEYNFVMSFFVELCHYSPLIPDDRVQLTARGLYLGFESRFSESIHLISPQVEFMVRNLLKQANVRTSTIDEAGIENEVGLSSLLDKPEAKSLLGDDLHFNLVSLYTDPLGANIRNCVAHGLLDDYSSQSDAVIYAWWLYFKIIVKSVTQAPLFTFSHPE
ncbi:TPA: DUF4209 domain-containing protein [Serratia rubidaea]|nr:DUF4209 domain-containing protein [Serratia rubidaea]HDJ1451283.1 DUF4209 domain-containing protein [Serratia rubidaea]HDJ1464151.1 DUF4209 domain-containing protein [Serratia rubidaea]HDJ2774617.1 DUF4209 domain-containing protein [Serratia rubidaea]